MRLESTAALNVIWLWLGLWLVELVLMSPFLGPDAANKYFIIIRWFFIRAEVTFLEVCLRLDSFSGSGLYVGRCTTFSKLASLLALMTR
jgi:hypothetical protein